MSGRLFSNRKATHPLFYPSLKTHHSKLFPGWSLAKGQSAFLSVIFTAGFTVAVPFTLHFGTGAVKRVGGVVVQGCSPSLGLLGSGGNTGVSGESCGLVDRSSGILAFISVDMGELGISADIGPGPGCSGWTVSGGRAGVTGKEALSCGD
jgi:hypothetical protein